MIQLDSRQLKEDAARLVDRARDPKKLVLIHTGVLVLLTLLGSALNLYLDTQISGTSGLGGMGTRSILQTIQQVIQVGTTLFTPFWQAGFLLVTIRWASGATAEAKDLLSGFRRIGGLLSYNIWTSLLYMNLLFISLYVGTMLVSFTSFAEPLLEVTQVMYEGSQEALNALSMEQILSAYAPVLVVGGLIFLPLFLFFHYTLRPTTWLLMRERRVSGFIAMRVSAAIMRKNRRQLFRLDLSFWWYYLLEFLTSAVAYLDVILVLLGVSLPVDPNVAFFATLILYGVLNLGLHLWMKAKVDTTYALAYEILAEPVLHPPAQAEQGT